MNIQRARREITETVRAYLVKDARGEYVIPSIRQRPILLMGPPGIGKTQIMEQAARECGVALVAYTITHHTRQSAVGLPFIREKEYGGKMVSVTEYTMSEIIASIYDKMAETGLREGILFIDEINCVSETLAPTMLQFLQAKKFGNQAVPEGWVICAAGNPPEYNKSVRDFDIVTLDRVKRMDIEPDYNAFKTYAREAGLYPAILAYLELHPDRFYRINADVDGTQFVTARGWEDLSHLLYTYDTLGLSADEDTIREYLQHKEIAEDFSAYLDLYRKYQDTFGVDEILAGKPRASVYARMLNAPFDERLSLVSLLLAGLRRSFAARTQAADLADDAYDLLRRYKGALAEPEADAAPANVLAGIEENDRFQYELQKKAGLLDARSAARTAALLAQESAWVQLLQNEAPADADMAFALLRQDFGNLSDARDDAEEAAGAALEHAFDFMEQAFTAGQELVVFVTELSLLPDAQRFITECGCPRYFAYSKTLLTDSRRAALQAELAANAGTMQS